MNAILSVAALVHVVSAPALADPAEVSAAWEAYRAEATLPVPALTDKQLEALDAGENVKLRLPKADDAPVGVMVLATIDLPKQDLWLSSLDDDEIDQDDFIMHQLPVLGSELQRWYGFMDIPAPFEDRHFVVRTTINEGISERSGGAMWERWWVLDPSGKEPTRADVAAGQVSGLDLATFDAAIFLPSNQGAWIFVDLPGGRTLFGYHTAAALGGAIPDSLVTAYLFRGLDEIVAGTTTRARRMHTHYASGHAPLAGGAGQPISRY